MLTREQKMAAYERLTRHLRSMWHEERTALDFSPRYDAALMAVHEGRDADALALTDHLRTLRGDQWRARSGKNWSN